MAKRIMGPTEVETIRSEMTAMLRSLDDINVEDLKRRMESVIALCDKYMDIINMEEPSPVGNLADRFS